MMDDDFTGTDETDSPMLDIEELFSAFVSHAVWMGEVEPSYTAFRKILGEFYAECAEERPSIIQVVEANIDAFMNIFDGATQKCFL